MKKRISIPGRLGWRGLIKLVREIVPVLNEIRSLDVSVADSESVPSVSQRGDTVVIIFPDHRDRLRRLESRTAELERRIFDLENP